MERIYSKADVQAVYDEVDRRINMRVKDGELAAEDGYTYPEAIESCRLEMLQGVYSVLMVLSSNWPEVRIMCDNEEECREYFTENEG